MSIGIRLGLFVVLLVIVILIGPLALSWVWGWVVPDVFVGAVEQGVLPASIAWGQAFKLLILLMLLGVTGRSSSK